MLDIEKDQSLRKCGTIVEVDQPKRGKFITIGCPPKLSSFTPKVGPAPLLGANTDEVLKELGYSADQISKLRANHIV